MNSIGENQVVSFDLRILDLEASVKNMGNKLARTRVLNIEDNWIGRINTFGKFSAIAMGCLAAGYFLRVPVIRIAAKAIFQPNKKTTHTF